jgi:hypothetical protein
MPSTLDFTPARLDLKLYAGDDTVLDLVFITEPPPQAGTEFAGPYDTGTEYVPNQMVESVGLLYVSLVTSTNLTPATNPAAWQLIPSLDLSGYVNWQAQIRSSATDSNDFTVDDSQQASSIITISLPASTATARQSKGTQRWDIQAQDPDGFTHTFFAGNVSIESDVTQ